MKTPEQISHRWVYYFLTFLILLLAGYTVVGERGVIHLWRLRGEKAKLDEHNFAVQRHNEALRKQISRLRNDNFYLEKIAREELNLVRPGEIIYRFPPSKPRKNRASALSESVSEPPRSMAQKERR
jgi:cell division protein FtsB